MFLVCILALVIRFKTSWFVLRLVKLVLLLPSNNKKSVLQGEHFFLLFAKIKLSSTLQIKPHFYTQLRCNNFGDSLF